MSGASEEDGGRATEFLSVVKQGRSFSGHERHCSFLNLGGGKFADVSVISGFDFPDDGRGLALTDWDRDGDLDLWVSNRNGPQLRYLENRNPAIGNFVSVHLEGRSCNRDAIGARVLVHLPDDARPLMKTLRAGDGFLSQSSKWLHFGLGETETKTRITVHWPDGSQEYFDDVRPNRRYHIIQGEGITGASLSDAPSLAAQAPVAAVAPAESSAIFLSSRPPMPPVLYRDRHGAGHRVRFSGEPGTGTLIVLWASWCPSCRTELERLAGVYAQLQEAGIEVVALSIDHLAHDASPADQDRAMDLAKKWRLPFPAGRALDSVPAVFEAIERHIFDRHTSFQVPVSWMIDHQGEIAAIYRGLVETEVFFRDAARLDLAGSQRRGVSVPFPGRWLAPVRRLHPVDVALHLIDGGHDDVSLAYYADNARLLAGHGRSPRLLLRLGQALERKFRHRDALEFYRGVLSQNAQHVEALSRRAILLATTPEPSLRDVHEAQTLAERAVDLSRRRDPLAWHALGVVKAEQEFFHSAQSAVTEALALLVDDEADGALKNALQDARKRYEQKKPFRRPGGE